jgi:hypothetical protein
VAQETTVDVDAAELLLGNIPARALAEMILGPDGYASDEPAPLLDRITSLLVDPQPGERIQERR